MYCRLIFWSCRCLFTSLVFSVNMLISSLYINIWSWNCSQSLYDTCSNLYPFFEPHSINLFPTILYLTILYLFKIPYSTPIFCALKIFETLTTLFRFLWFGKLHHPPTFEMFACSEAISQATPRIHLKPNRVDYYGFII